MTVEIVNPPPSINGPLVGGTAGSVLFINSLKQIAQNNSKLFWDNTLFRLGIGTPTPNYSLEVAGSIAATGGNIILNDSTGNFYIYVGDFNSSNLSGGIFSQGANDSSTGGMTTLSRGNVNANPFAVSEFVQMFHYNNATPKVGYIATGATSNFEILVGKATAGTGYDASKVAMSIDYSTKTVSIPSYVLIGKNTNNGNIKLQVNGDILIPNTFAIYMEDTAASPRQVLLIDGSNIITLRGPGSGIISIGGDTNASVYFTGKVTKYNNIDAVSNGIPSELATIDSTGLTANVGASTLYAVPASGAGMYRVSAYLVTTTAASVSSTMPNAQVVFTDKDSNTSITMDVSPILGAAGLGQTGLLTANTVGTVFTGVVTIYVKASTTIQYQTVNYASTAAGMAYALHLKLEAL